jgi:hypothetical protein
MKGKPMNQKQEKETLAQLVTITRAIRQLRKKNLAVFEKLEKLSAEETKLTTSLKESVRGRIVEEAQGGTLPPGKINVYASEDALVQAIVKNAPRAYDATIARAEWPRAAFNTCSKIDPKKVDALVTEGKLSEELAGKAIEEKKVLTAAVTIDVLDGKRS